MIGKAFKKNPVLKYGCVLAVTAGIIYLLSIFHMRFDLTSEKRYTLSVFTKNALQDLDSTVNIDIYLEGDLNIPFQKMKQRLKETLEEFQVYGGSHIEYRFINPFEGKDAKATDKFLNQLMARGLKATNIMEKDKEGGSKEKLVIPGAIVRYGKAEIPVNLLKNNPGASSEENINNSIEDFEFELMRVISAITADSTEKIAFIEGHGEFNNYQVADITNELSWNFQVDRGRIDGKPGILDEYKAVIIAGPDKPFNERDKFVLDQYMMKGGKLLLFIDMVNASLDSIGEGRPHLAMIRTPNIEDMLFRYGVRINPVLIQDIQCSMIPVNVALAGNPPDFRPAPWLYSPLLSAPYGNSITRNLNMIKTEFTGSMDTIAARTNIKKTVLLSTSQYSRIVTAPLLISLDEIRLTPQEQDFRDGFLPVAVMLEGIFESAFRNRMLNGLFPDTAVNFLETGQPSSILVVSDADVIRNDYRPTPKGVMITPLGFDRYTSQTYGNKEFIVNAIQYMTGHKGLIQLRSREIKIRLLDKAKLKRDQHKWVLINTVMPPLVVIIAGLLFNWFRRKKNSGI